MNEEHERHKKANQQGHATTLTINMFSILRAFMIMIMCGNFVNYGRPDIADEFGLEQLYTQEEGEGESTLAISENMGSTVYKEHYEIKLVGVCLIMYFLYS